MDNRELIFRPQFGKGQNVSYTGTAGTISNALPIDTTAVWVWTTSDAYIRIGQSPTAVTTDFPIPAMTPMVFPVSGFDTQSANGAKVSALRITADGTMYVCPI